MTDFDVEQAFAINESTGLVVVGIKTLDVKQITNYELVVQTTDGIHTVTATVSINVQGKSFEITEYVNVHRYTPLPR